MTVTRYPLLTQASAMPSDGSSPDLTILNVSRLFARLEHNLLSSTADLKPLRRSEYQRMRVGANIDYARTALLTLEKSLSGIKPVGRRHEIQTEIARRRQVMRALVGVLEEISTQAAWNAPAAQDGGRDGDLEEDDDVDEGEGELLVLDGSDDEEDGFLASEGGLEQEGQERQEDKDKKGEGEVSPPSQHTPIPTSTSPPTLRNRHHQQPTATATTTATATPSPPIHPHQPLPSSSNVQTTEQTLSTNRHEQETLTDSLLSLATQLKTSSTAFHTSLESEKSVLDRTVDGLDATTSNMGAAEKRMGMLRKMTEGKGWWGRMMLYAWIVALWVVAILIVFLGPKLRF